MKRRCTLARAMLPAAVGLWLLAAIAPAPSCAQERAPAPAAAMLGLGATTIHPLGEAHRLVIGGAPKFRFAIELANAGQPPAGLPQHALAEGSGSVVRGPRNTYWQFRFQRLTVNQQTYAAVSDFTILDVEVPHDAPARRAYAVDYRGLEGSPYGGPGAPLRNLMVLIAHAVAHGALVPPLQPVGDRSVVYDLGEAVRVPVALTMSNAQLLQPLAPAAAVGAIDYRQRRVVLAGMADRAVFRTGQGDVALRVEAAAAIDRETALPLLSRLRAFGPIDTAAFRGPVDLTITTALALGDMGDPAAALPRPQPLAATPARTTEGPPPGVEGPPSGVEGPPAGTEGPPPDTVDAPAGPRPPAKPAAAPKPPAASKPPAEKPATAAPPKPPAATGDDVTRRLEQLKSLFDRGLITKEQYEAKQKEILGAL
ncbi:MAG: SHOCT domain-containing protein [Hyphomicrobiaceae bacterium]|nr:SHOCT domain-containing protein [Hyphomicrobiaceae bacterium]